MRDSWLRNNRIVKELAHGGLAVSGFLLCLAEPASNHDARIENCDWAFPHDLFVAAAFGDGCVVIKACLERIVGHLVESGPPALGAPFRIGQDIT
jgi:hypothetical protein